LVLFGCSFDLAAQFLFDAEVGLDPGVGVAALHAPKNITVMELLPTNIAFPGLDQLRHMPPLKGGLNDHLQHSIYHVLPKDGRPVIALTFMCSRRACGDWLWRRAG
jgi:hypothetical protein